MVCHCWPIAFGNVRNNRKAIVERGWHPYNKVLLLDTTLRVKMAEAMIRKERRSGLFPLIRLPELFSIQYVMNQGDVFMNMNVQREQRDSQTRLNFDAGITARYVSNAIMTEVDRQQARERNQRNRQAGTTARERLQTITRRLTAGRLTTEGRHYHLNSDVLEHIQRQDNEAEAIEREKRRNDELRYLKHCYLADKAIEKNKNVKLPYWKNASDLIKFLKPLKLHKSDGAMPTKRCEIEAKCMLWRNRSRRTLVVDNVVQERFDAWVG